MIDDKCQGIIKKCKFIAKKNTWFIEGSVVDLIDNNYLVYEDNTKFGTGCSTFSGYTNRSLDEYFFENCGSPIRYDQETCDFSEFLIYDEYGNEISELTLNDYLQILREQKINTIIK